MNKGGYNAVVRAPIATAQAAPDGSRIYYEGESAFPSAAGNDAIVAGHLSQRSETGWHTTELTPASPLGTPVREYMLAFSFNEELTQMILKAPLVLAPEANPNAFNLYAHTIGAESSMAGAAYTWMNPVALPKPAQRPGAGEPGLSGWPENALAFAGASADFSRVLFESDTPNLLAGSPGTEAQALYETAEGTVRLVGVLPDGHASATGATAGAGSRVGYPFFPARIYDRVENAISEDGERVVFQAQSDEGSLPAEQGQNGMIEVYDRIAHSATVELSAPMPGANPANSTAEPAQFWGASPGGARVYFTSSAELTTASNTGTANDSADLYEYDVDTHTLTDLSVDRNPADASTGAGVLGTIGAGESVADGSYVYFVATGQLVAGRGVDGQPNLYVVHNDGSPEFIATLTPRNSKLTEQQEVEGFTTTPSEVGDSLDWRQAPAGRAYVTPNGRTLAFTSRATIATANFPSGYDNLDAVSGEPDSEVYKYVAPTPEQAAVDAPGELVCASCDPHGAPPAGPAFLAGSGYSVGNFGFATASTPFHKVRAVSASGERVFFTGPPFDEEKTADAEETAEPKLYEYEGAGEGSCREAPACTFRLSEATNPTPVLFLDAGGEGQDVFFATYSQLAPTDDDNLIDVYDAHELGGFPEQPVSQECEAECRTGPSPAAGPPLASAVNGPSGNVSTVTAVTQEKTGKPNPKPKPRKLSCAARAKKIGKAKARKRALRKCAKARKPSRRTGHRAKGGKRR